VLTEAEVGGYRHFRCHVGHAFSLESLVGEQTEDVERALWAAVRSLEEGAALAQRVGRTAATPDLRRRFVIRHQDLLRQADLIRRILLRGPTLEGAAETDTEKEEVGGVQVGPEEPPQPH
jgi:two-component system chemotaxis response regulator CheB